MATIVIRCVDARYSKAGVRQVLPEAYDFTYPGAALGIVHDAAWRTNLFTQWQKLAALGLTIDAIVIVDHYCAEGKHGCKAYHDDDSRKRHEYNLHAAALLIQETPDFRATPLHLHLHDIDKGTLEAVKKP